MRKSPSLLLSALWLLAIACTPFCALAESVATYHGDTLRTGWNKNEKTLTVANVGGGGFGLQAMTTLNSQVDAQPLVIPKQKIAGHGVHTVVYVVTGGDTLYAIDGKTGAVLQSRNFGTPVPESALPGGCNNNGSTVGITSTPAIDTASGTMYLIADTYENNAAVFRLHAVSLSTLQDVISPVVITASAPLSDGSTYTFNPTGSRQRAALLLAGNKIYAGFSSYCDQAASTTRGWLLGWNTSNLAPLAHNQLQDAVPNGLSSFFLNAIWMSGYGPSTASANNTIYLVTSNSDKNTYGSADRDESVLKITPDLASTTSFYTDPNRANLDQGDADLGAGGAMLAPDQPGLDPKLLFAAGKTGTMYMFDRSADAGLGLLGSYPIGGCWCGPSYFTGSDKVGRVVTSGGSNVIIWKINTPSNAAASLTQQFSTAITSGEDPGFFTSISSDGTTAGTAVIWAVGRPTNVPGTMPLYAIDPGTGKIIFKANAGNWVSSNSDADTVPTVANGRVYVATYQELAIFGLGSPAAPVDATVFATQARHAAAQKRPGFQLQAGEHAVWGIIQAVTPSKMVLKTRSGQLVQVDLSAAWTAGNVAAPVVGQATVAIGSFAPGGVLVASHVEHAKPEQGLWPQDQ
jgi:hypothetical protein